MLERTEAVAEVVNDVHGPVVPEFGLHDGAG